MLNSAAGALAGVDVALIRALQSSMFVREKTINGYSYLVLVESVREGGRTKQRIIKNLGRKESVLANGDLERHRTVARHRGCHGSHSREAGRTPIHAADRTRSPADAHPRTRTRGEPDGTVAHHRRPRSREVDHITAMPPENS